MSISLLEVYDDAERGDKGTHWNHQYLDETLAVQVQGENQVYIWFQNRTDVDNMFDTTDYGGAGEFEDAVDEWVREHK